LVLPEIMNPPCPFTFKKVRENGFTLTELFVVIATVAILAVLLLPAIAGTKPDTQAFQCLENLRQLTLAWQMYAADNSGKLAMDGDQGRPNAGTFPTDPSMQPGGSNYVWAAGNMQQFTTQWTNYLEASSLFPYLKTISVFHCPADASVINEGRGLTLPHVRSYSMNGYMAPIDPWSSVGEQATRNFYKDTDINNPRPSMAYVFIGENEYSINDSFFVSDPEQRNFWQDIPETRHGGAGSLSYADGHSEMKRWTDKNILNYTGTSGQFGSDPNSGDNAWLEQRATSLIP
jgi:prepilin-type processing-associated H-X9-DG protein